jgi:F5/8 type C domain
VSRGEAMRRTTTGGAGMPIFSIRGRVQRGALLPLALIVLLGAGAARAQTVRVDTTASRAIGFDPDKALGSSIDILPAVNFDEVYTPENLKESLSAGWGPISYRQNTELTYEAWHWNPEGTWSDPAHQGGYFTGSATPGAEPLRESFGYSLPHRGVTRGDASMNEFSRLTDGDESTYWKSDPYLAKRFTGEDDALLPQWIVIDFGTPQPIDAIRIAWANPYATQYDVEYWTGDDAMMRQAAGYWTIFPTGGVQNGKGGAATLRLSEMPIVTRYVRIRMAQSSNTCDTHGASDPRNCVGYAVDEVYAGNFTADGKFMDLIKHTPGQAQTATWVSSTDPWHTAADRVPLRVQTGFDLLYTSGLTNHLPAMIPIAMIYSTPEDSAAEIAYIEKRGYPISYVEMGEEPDGAFMTPEDYAALYIQWAAALHRVDPKLKLGGPIFTGVTEDIASWPDTEGRTSWLGRFIDYLKVRGRLKDLSFVSFEHYPFSPCETTWTDLYREAGLTRHIMNVWRDDGIPASVPLMITESNVSWALTDPMQDVFSALWLADSVGSFLANGGALYTHSPIQPEPLRPGCHAFSTYGNFVADRHLHILQHTAQYFASRMINLDWVRHGEGVEQLYPAESDLRDDAGHDLVTAYAAKRPDGEWSLMLINKDPTNAHAVKIEFASSAADAQHFAGRVSVISFGAAQYVWRPEGIKSHADPDGPPVTSTVEATASTTFTLPRASVIVLRGRVE